MGKVYLARDQDLDRLVAIKLLTRSEDLDLRRRFAREAEILSQIDHPSVVKIYDHGETFDACYLVMEYLDGTPMDQVQAPADPLPWMLPIAEALEVLHGLNLVHRDLKPANLIRTREGRSVLLDFGLIKAKERTVLTKTGMLVGTPIYLPPEMLLGHPAQPAADWYAWGATLYTLAEGRPPFDTQAVLDWMTKQEEPPLRFQKIPRGSALEALIRRCLDPDPEVRPASVEEIQALLDLSGSFPRRPSPTPGSGARSLASSIPEQDVIESGGHVPLSSNTQTVSEVRNSRLPGWFLPFWMTLLAIGFGYLFGRQASPDRPLPSPPPESQEAPGEAAPNSPFRWLETNAQGHQEYEVRKTRTRVILVPGGPFRSVRTRAGSPEETTLEVDLSPYLISKYESTLGEYYDYLDQLGRRPSSILPRLSKGARMPACLIHYDEIAEYARWAGARLPSIAEWQRAASGGDSRRYPWGNQDPSPKLANYGETNVRVVFRPTDYIRPVGSYPKGISPIGALDMAGNVYEWTSEQVPAKTASGWAEAYLMGGNFGGQPEHLQIRRIRLWPQGPDADAVGFRLVWDAPKDLPPPGTQSP